MQLKLLVTLNIGPYQHTNSLLLGKNRSVTYTKTIHVSPGLHGKVTPGEYLYKPGAFDTILIYLYMCVILVSVNISE